MNTSICPSSESLLDVVPDAAHAWRHGMYARKVLVPAEDLPGFEALRDALVAEWRPRSVTAWMLVDHLAKLQWRLMRAGEAEAERLTTLMSQRGITFPVGGTATPEGALAWDAGRQSSTLQRIQLCQMRLERSVHLVIGQLIVLRKLRVKPGGLGRAGARTKSAETVAGPGIVESTQK